MMKLKMPKLGRSGTHAPRLPHRGVRTAFGAGPHAFAPSNATVPDQAFGAAMALPQDDAMADAGTPATPGP